MTALTRKRALYIAAESTFATDPDSDGSDYVYVPAFSIGDLKDEKQQLETNYMTGRVFPTAPLAGADGASFDIEVPLIGMAASAGIGTNASTVTNDWLDILLATVFTQSTTAGEGVGVGSTTSSLVLDTDSNSVQDVIPVWESGIPTAGPRAQWAFASIDAGTGTYTISPVLSAAPTTAAVAYGVKNYQASPTTPNAATFAAVYLEDQGDSLEYTNLGCKVTALSLTAEVGQIVKLKMTITCDRKSLTSKFSSSLPVANYDAAPSVTPIKALLSGVWVGTSAYDTRKLDVDFGLNVASIDAVAATNGRAGMIRVAMEPTISIEPLRTDTLTNLKRNATASRILMQFGDGNSSSVNTWALCAGSAVATAADPSDDKGISRNAMTFKVVDAGLFSAGVLTRFIQFVRA